RRIGIAFSDEEEFKLVSITNSGEGLSEEEMGHIFDSFYRGSNVGRNSGSGLGLYICKKLMHMMHGDIFAENTDGEMRLTLVCRKK
nr:sensor histidine kinase [Lachnospiraceae bacterium]